MYSPEGFTCDRFPPKKREFPFDACVMKPSATEKEKEGKVLVHNRRRTMFCVLIDDKTYYPLQLSVSFLHCRF